MADREKVIRALENCTARDQCIDCPWESCEHDSPTLRMPLDLAIEALEILMPEHVEPEVGGLVEPDGHGSWWYQCGACKCPIDYKDQYCRQCGRPVKWDG